MQPENLCKRKRGGQPGNRNAIGNRGNRRARGQRGNRGGRAPLGNQNARKRPKAPLEFLRREYQDSPEALAWLQQNAVALKGADFGADDQRDAALFAAFCGLTPEALTAQGREFQLGLYTLPDEAWLDEEGEAEEVAA